MESKRVMQLMVVLTLVTIFSCQVSSARRLAEDAALRKLTFAYLVTTDADLGTRTPRDSEAFEAVIKKQRVVTHDAQDVDVPKSTPSTHYKHLEEIDRLKVSINKLICEAMEEEGCEGMDDSASHMPDTNEDEENESFAALNPRDHVLTQELY